METDYSNAIKNTPCVSKPKIPVEATLTTSPEGKMTPLSIKWKDGRTFEIESVVDIKPKDSNHIVYIVLIHGKKRCLHYDNRKWLVEAKG